MKMGGSRDSLVVRGGGQAQGGQGLQVEGERQGCTSEHALSSSEGV